MSNMHKLYKDRKDGKAGAEEAISKAAIEAYESGWKRVKQSRYAGALRAFLKAERLSYFMPEGSFPEVPIVILVLQRTQMEPDSVDIDWEEFFREPDEMLVEKVREVQARVADVTVTRLNLLLDIFGAQHTVREKGSSVDGSGPNPVEGEPQNL